MCVCVSVHVCMYCSCIVSVFFFFCTSIGFEWCGFSLACACKVHLTPSQEWISASRQNTGNGTLLRYEIAYEKGVGSVIGVIGMDYLLRQRYDNWRNFPAYSCHINWRITIKLLFGKFFIYITCTLCHKLSLLEKVFYNEAKLLRKAPKLYSKKRFVNP